MGRRRKEDIINNADLTMGGVFPIKPVKNDKLEQMNQQARERHKSYGQLQAELYSGQIEFTYAGNELKTVRERLRKKKLAENAAKPKKRGRPKKIVKE